MTEQNPDMFEGDTLPADIADHLPDVSDEVKKKWPKQLVTLLAMFDASLHRMGYKDADAEKISHAMLAELSVYCGGRYVYMPKADVLKKAIRDIKLFNDWHVNNMQPDDLAQKYDITVKQVYLIIKDQRKYHINKIQPQLFN